MAHITGGGLPDNMPRALRDDVAAHIDARTWPILPVFRWMQSVGGGVDPFEMSRAFNCGIGMVLIVAHDAVDEIMASVRAQGEQIYRIGELKARSADQPQVVISGLEEAFRA
jgi:phosphoribosylamine--glycine ligase/phosphoribosylformylglycinamidine cyclo-ligase